MELMLVERLAAVSAMVMDTTFDRAILVLAFA
jgi:hypothetical protein